MKCSKCGAPIQLNQKYCPNCGSLNEENAKHVSDMENYDSKFNKTRKQVVSNSKWFVKYMAPITAMVIAIIAIAAAIVWNQALGGYDLAHAENFILEQIPDEEDIDYEYPKEFEKKIKKITK